MNRFWTRRITCSTATLIVVYVLLRMQRHRAQWLDRPDDLTGGVLFTAVIFLALFNVRKRLAFVPLGSASTWLQLHIYIALGAAPLFWVHTGMRVPNGHFETLLYAAFTLTWLSGAVGLYFSRTIPKRLTKLREQIIYERIPFLRRQVQIAAHAVVVDLVRQYDADAIADFYVNRLVDFFGRPRSFVYKLTPTSRLRNELQSELRALTRFINADKRIAQDELRRLIDQRDDLDYHSAQQGRLKGWLFVHLGLTAILIALMTVHVAMVCAFAGT